MRGQTESRVPQRCCVLLGLEGMWGLIWAAEDGLALQSLGNICWSSCKGAGSWGWV